MPTKLTVRKTSFLKKQSWRERRRQQLSKTSSGYGSFSDSDSDEVSSSPTANHSDSSIDEGVVAKSVKGNQTQLSLIDWKINQQMDE